MQGYTLFAPLKIWGNLVIPTKKTRGMEPICQTIFLLGLSDNAQQKYYSHSHSCVILEVTIHGVIDYLTVYQYGVKRNLGLLTIRVITILMANKSHFPVPYLHKSFLTHIIASPLYKTWLLPTSKKQIHVNQPRSQGNECTCRFPLTTVFQWAGSGRYIAPGLRLNLKRITFNNVISQYLISLLVGITLN